MARWEPESRRRLEEAAMALYGERGFDNTTVAEIAERARLTERTFFRHFADKREVLFWGAGALQDLFVSAVATAPVGASPLEAVGGALAAAAAVLEQRGDFPRQRQKIIASSAELQERELIKLASLATALAEALRRRGVKDPTAGLTAEVAVAVFKTAFERWVEEGNKQALTQLMEDSFKELKGLTSSG